MRSLVLLLLLAVCLGAGAEAIVGAPCVVNTDCDLCESCPPSGTCQYITYGNEDPDHGCTDPDACGGDGYCGLSEGNPCAVNADCASQRCRYDPDDAQNYCITPLSDCVYDLDGSGGYYSLGNLVNWACSSDPASNGDCLSSQHICLAAGDWRCSSHGDPCAYCAGDFSYQGSCDDSGTNDNDVESCTDADGGSEYAECTTCNDDGPTTSGVDYGDTTQDAAGGNLCNGANDYCCAGSCVTAGGAAGAACGSSECSGTWICDGSNYKCSSMVSVCAYCAATPNLDDGYTSTCNRDGDCLGGLLLACPLCEACADDGSSVSCSVRPLGSYDPELSNLCTSSGDGCAGSSCSCDGTSGPGSCRVDSGESCTSDSDCSSNVCLYDPAQAGFYCVPAGKECIYSGNFYDEYETAPWECIDQQPSGDCYTATHRCLANSSWICSTNNSDCGYCVGDDRYLGKCSDTQLNNDAFEDCKINLIETCGQCLYCDEDGDTASCKDINCGEDTGGPLAEQCDDSNSGVCSNAAICFPKISDGDLCDPIDIVAYPEFNGCGGGDDSFCLSGDCCIDGFCKGGIEGCCSDSDCLAMERCDLYSGKSCIPFYGFSDDYSVSQSFTAGLTGFFSRVRVQIMFNSTDGVPAINAEIRNSVDDGSTGCAMGQDCPGDTVLAYGSRAGITYSDYTWTDIPMSASYLVFRNTKYHLVLYTDSTSDDKAYIWNLSDTGYAGDLSYSTDGANTWTYSTDGDLYFETYVRELRKVGENPEPAVVSQSKLFGDTQQAAQTFSPNVSGELGLVKLLLGYNGGTADDILVNIYEDFECKRGTEIAIGTVTGFTAPGYEWKNVSFFGDAPYLFEGQDYYVVLESCGSDPNTYTMATTPDQYPNGTLINRSSFSIDCIIDEPIMWENTLTDQFERINDSAFWSLHLDTVFIPDDTMIYQDNATGPWDVRVNMSVNFSVEAGIAMWNVSAGASVLLSLVSFKDPLYLAYTNGSSANTINPTNITGWNGTRLAQFIAERDYRYEPLAPSYLMRIVNNITNSTCCGIESVVDPATAAIVGERCRSYADYCFFGDACPSEDYGMLYNITIITNSSYKFMLNFYQTNEEKYNSTNVREATPC
ncbi:MAG: hypothetical protein ABH879_03280 [archaeon]